MTAPTPLHLAVVTERHVGLATYADNLRECLRSEPGLVTAWYPVEYTAPGWWDRVPVPSGARAALSGRAEAQRAAGTASEAVVFNTQVPAVLGGRRARSSTYFLCTDVTPRQYDAMAAGYGHRVDRPGPVRGLKHVANRHVFRHATRIFPWSTWVARSLVEDYEVDPDRIVVVPPGVDTTRWRPADEPRAAGPVRLLFVGGDLDRKGGRQLLGAYRALPVGACELMIVTRTALDPEPGVTVVNDVSPNDPRLLELYRSSDVFVLPSRAETFGIAYLEATASGMPIIAGRSGGVEDIVHDGETGYVVDPDDPVALAAALRKLVEDGALRRRLGERGRAHAVANFDARTNARRLVSTIRDSLPS
jgi:glycosyltransferase involved in cell wall biosynthesis